MLLHLQLENVLFFFSSFNSLALSLFYTKRNLWDNKKFLLIMLAHEIIDVDKNYDDF